MYMRDIKNKSEAASYQKIKPKTNAEGGKKKTLSFRIIRQA